MRQIGVSDPLGEASDLERYTGWLRQAACDVNIVVVSANSRNPQEAGTLDGVVLTGGGDVHPVLYGRPDDLAAARRINVDRDRFELELFRRAVDAGVPLLGICRGAQLANVALGGTLVADLEAAGYSNHRRPATGERRHGVQIAPESVLREIAGAERAEVNSSHHQAVESPGRGLCVTARSDDGVIEGLEWCAGGRRPFLLLIQWHPERMEADAALSSGVRERFMAEVERFAVRTE